MGNMGPCQLQAGFCFQLSSMRGLVYVVAFLDLIKKEKKKENSKSKSCLRRRISGFNRARVRVWGVRVCSCFPVAYVSVCMCGIQCALHCFYSCSCSCYFLFLFFFVCVAYNVSRIALFYSCSCYFFFVCVAYNVSYPFLPYPFLPGLLLDLLPQPQAKWTRIAVAWHT